MLLAQVLASCEERCQAAQPLLLAWYRSTETASDGASDSFGGAFGRDLILQILEPRQGAPRSLLIVRYWVVLVTRMTSQPHSVDQGVHHGVRGADYLCGGFVRALVLQEIHHLLVDRDSVGAGSRGLVTGERALRGSVRLVRGRGQRAEPTGQRSQAVSDDRSS